MTELGVPESWFSAFRRLADAEHVPELTARLRLVSPEAARDAEASLAIMERARAAARPAPVRRWWGAACSSCRAPGPAPAQLAVLRTRSPDASARP
jgi:hypothetical protein